MPSIPIPSKGDIVTIENKQYRVLKVTGTVVEVLAMYDAGTQAVNETSKTVIFTGGKSGQQYKDSDLDTYLNETFFATLSATMQGAIVPKDINQDMWDYTASSSTTSGTYYNQKYGSNNRYYYDSNYGTAEVGSRNVYVLSIRDVIDYLNVPANGVFTDTDIWQMFWNDNTKHSGQYLWLRSAYRYDETYVFYVIGDVGYMDSYLCSRPYRVRPVFQIDWDILYPSTPTLTFKHFYDAGTIGSGTYKFRHYSQQEPSSGNVIKAGTYLFNETLSVASEISVDAELIGLMNTLTANNAYGGTVTFEAMHLEEIRTGVELLDIYGANGEHISSDWSYSYYDEVREEDVTYTATDTTKLRTIIIETDQTVGDVFYTWFTANTTKLS